MPKEANFTIEDIDYKTVAGLCALNADGSRQVVNLGEVDVLDVVAGYMDRGTRWDLGWNDRDVLSLLPICAPVQSMTSRQRASLISLLDHTPIHSTLKTSPGLTVANAGISGLQGR